MVNDGGKVMVDAGEAFGGLHARGGIDAAVCQGPEAVLIVVQYAPAYDGKARVYAQYDHGLSPFPTLYHFIITQIPRQVKGFS
jgi:hypothetical protein